MDYGLLTDGLFVSAAHSDSKPDAETHDVI